MQYILTEEEFDKLNTERLTKYEDKEEVSSLRAELIEFIKAAQLTVTPLVMSPTNILNLQIDVSLIPENLYNFIKNIKGIKDGTQV